ncbi:MAG: dTDP-4-dehydrorhamnose reductase [Anaerolineales bacterium]
MAETSQNAVCRRILLFGKNGQLGWELEHTLAPLGTVKAVDFPEVDLADADGVRRLVRELRPEIIVNAAAYTAVDRAESEPELAMAVNGIAPGVLAEEARALGACLVHFSTDYVFDGEKRQPYVETDSPNPLNVYGRTKLAGEEAICTLAGTYLILRTSWVYSLRGDSFVNKVLRWAREQEILRVVSDQVASPTWARLLAEVTAQALTRGIDCLQEHRGLYHLAGSGSASRFQWARSILKLDCRQREQVVKQVLPARTSEFPTSARRPLFSALDCGRFALTFGLSLPPWESSLELAMAED